MFKIESEGGNAFIVFEDGAREMLQAVSTYEPGNGQRLVALETGSIVIIELALAIARTQRDHWQRIAEQRGTELANLRAREPDLAEPRMGHNEIAAICRQVLAEAGLSPMYYDDVIYRFADKYNGGRTEAEVRSALHAAWTGTILPGKAHG